MNSGHFAASSRGSPGSSAVAKTSSVDHLPGRADCNLGTVPSSVVLICLSLLIDPSSIPLLARLGIRESETKRNGRREALPVATLIGVKLSLILSRKNQGRFQCLFRHSFSPLGPLSFFLINRPRSPSLGSPHYSCLSHPLVFPLLPSPLLLLLLPFSLISGLRCNKHSQTCPARSRPPSRWPRCSASTPPGTRSPSPASAMLTSTSRRSPRSRSGRASRRRRCVRSGCTSTTCSRSSRGSPSTTGRGSSATSSQVRAEYTTLLV